MKRKIVIIDDSQGDRQLIQDYLTEAGFDLEYYPVVTGEEGLEQVKRLRPEIVVIDTKLPGMDGFETCRQIKKAAPQTKVIILTGVIDAVDSSKAREAGADEFTIKTSNYDVFTASFRDMLG